VRRHSLPRCSGFTLVEILVAGSVTLVGFLAVILLNSSNLRFVKSARQSNAATLCLQERAEQLRLADWRKITSSAYLKDTVLAAPAKSAAPLNELSEKITVAAFPDDTVAQKLVVQRDTNGNRSVLISGDGLATQRLAKVDLQVSWTGSDGRVRTRATTTLMANGGISRMNLPAFGAAAGAPSSTTTSTTTDTSTTTTDTTGTTTSNGNGNGNGNSNGRGNVGGKPGKN
jgi:Tfp pilus assembly protein PilV